MAVTALVVSILALILALAALAKASGAGSEIEESGRQARRSVQNLAEEQAGELEKLRRLLAVVAAGGELSEDMILEGRLWKDVDPRAGQTLVERAGGGEAGAEPLRILDVRTPQETSAGIIPGALLIPVDQLERRLEELPKDGRRTLVYCAGGGRSAAACEFLSERGYANLLNLAGGFGSWSGPTEKPGANAAR